MNFRTLGDVPMEYLHRVSNAAYADYVEPVHLSLEQLQYLLERRGYRPELSLGAFEGEDMVGFVFNGLGSWGGVPTAYETGTAVLPEWRRKGVSTRLFAALLPLMRLPPVMRVHLFPWRPTPMARPPPIMILW